MAGKKRKADSPLSPATPPHSRAMEAVLARLDVKLDGLSDDMRRMDAKLSKIDILENTIQQLRDDLSTVIADNGRKDGIISRQENRINACEQALRSTSVRIMGLPVTSKHTTPEIIDIVYSTIVTPILELAKSNNEIETFPTCRFAIENAFAVPGKSGSGSSVIVKFSSVYLRNTIFRNKKEALPSTKDPVTNKDRANYFIVEDLTPTNYELLQKFAKDERVKSAWTYNGQIRFKLKEGDDIYRVKNITDTVDSVTRSRRNQSAAAAIHVPP